MGLSHTVGAALAVMILAVSLASALPPALSSARRHRLAIEAVPGAGAGAPPRFTLDASPAFLNGVNQAWVYFGFDFGGGQGQRTLGQYNATIDAVAQAGGNSMRVWVHCDGASTPVFDSTGKVTATDSTGTLISDLASLLDAAHARGIVVSLQLFSGSQPGGHVDGLVKDAVTNAGLLQSYFDVVLTPVAKALSGHPALGSYEVLNEPESMIQAGQSSSNPCEDTSQLAGTGAGWLHCDVPMGTMLAFIARTAATIHAADASALVTVGSWSEHALAPRWLYTDECLTQAAGGDKTAALDFAQVHTYAWQGKYGTDPPAPFLTSADHYSLGKPLVVGEFSQDDGAGMTSPQQYVYAKTHAYAGAWGWQANGQGQDADNLQTLITGVKAAA